MECRERESSAADNCPEWSSAADVVQRQGKTCGWSCLLNLSLALALSPALPPSASLCVSTLRRLRTPSRQTKCMETVRAEAPPGDALLPVLASLSAALADAEACVLKHNDGETRAAADAGRCGVRRSCMAYHVCIKAIFGSKSMCCFYFGVCVCAPAPPFACAYIGFVGQELQAPDVGKKPRALA